jgi:ubiquinone/menaquinone biosynthesis C-methylase UbiE
MEEKEFQQTTVNYNTLAQNYSETREAMNWVLQPLSERITLLHSNSVVIEIGCGTGNYIIALSKLYADFTFKGFDLSEAMLEIARSRCANIEFSHGNASEGFPYLSDSCDFTYMVDVIHHIQRKDKAFQESARILKPGGKLVIVTDSEEDICHRSLTLFFPEILEVEHKRYPTLRELYHYAEEAGLTLIETKSITGTVELTDMFIKKLAAKCSSSLQLICDEDHLKGMKRVCDARQRGETWRSCYTLISYEKARLHIP